MKPLKRKRLILGVDDRIPSMIAASILRNQDFDLIGVHLSIDLGAEEELYPSALHRSDLATIEKTCGALGIPLKVIDATEEILGKVFDPYWISTLQGKPDSPNLRWLRDVLIPNLFKYADQFAAEGIATGHFASHSKRVLRYLDPNLDQSLAFATIQPEMLDRLVLPIGDVAPDMIVRLARELGSIAKDEKDYDGSRGLRALMADRQRRGNWTWSRKALSDPRLQAKAAGDFFKSGPVRSVDEFSLGEHDGIPFYPFGSPAPGHSDQFVIEIQPQSRTLLIGSESHLLARGAFIKDLNWTDAESHLYRERRVRVRSVREGSNETTGTVREYPGRLAELRFDTPLSRMGAGQTIVFLEETQVLGSGTVVEVQLEEEAEKAIEKIRKSD